MIKEWNVGQIGDLKGKVFVVTGGNSGIGYEAVKIFAAKGAKVVMACRSLERADAALAKIIDEQESADVVTMELDLASMESVRAFAEVFISKYKRLDVLMNNAGLMVPPYGITEDGFEQQLGVNHIGHFALTGLLFDVIKATPKARIVNISSNAHKFGGMRFDNMMFENGKGYRPMKAYAQSKIANLLFTYELQRKVDDAGLDVMVLAAHPGASATNLSRHMEKNAVTKFFGKFAASIMQGAYEGTLPGVRASLDVEAVGGTYYGPGGRGGMKGKPVIVESNKASHSEPDAKRLWTISQELTGVTFNI
ncbi:MAG: SDR family NAD(P)-dependent oxidoreductase [Clostridia bacterium]|jgi:NAD(P)-dependent dehydrogenase (short-subunit alcohol dehydrogenase family)|nr:SDR family NAD(P)-dependent oxidoreductase [Clostridia bacterium]MBT7122623.1 SDR family NAD(P)-dependent oxidoreductase [Clostridia bacterium]